MEELGRLKMPGAGGGGGEYGEVRSLGGGAGKEMC